MRARVVASSNASTLATSAPDAAGAWIFLLGCSSCLPRCFKLAQERIHLSFLGSQLLKNLTLLALQLALAIVDILGRRLLEGRDRLRVTLPKLKKQPARKIVCFP